MRTHTHTHTYTHTGERLEAGIKNALILQSDEAVVVTAQEEFVDTLPNIGKKTSLSLRPSPGSKQSCVNVCVVVCRQEFGDAARAWRQVDDPRAS